MGEDTACGMTRSRKRQYICLKFKCTVLSQKVKQIFVDRLIDSACWFRNLFSIVGLRAIESPRLEARGQFPLMSWRWKEVLPSGCLHDGQGGLSFALGFLNQRLRCAQIQINALRSSALRLLSSLDRITRRSRGRLPEFERVVTESFRPPQVKFMTFSDFPRPTATACLFMLVNERQKPLFDKIEWPSNSWDIMPAPNQRSPSRSRSN